MADEKKPDLRKYRRVKADKKKDEVAPDAFLVGRVGATSQMIGKVIDALSAGAEGKEGGLRAVQLLAQGSAVGKAVLVAEVTKRRVKGVHQISTLTTETVSDVYEPKKGDGEKVTVERVLAGIKIQLSLDQLDASTMGYQAPLDESLVTPEDMSKREKRPRAKGRGGKRGQKGGRGKGKKDEWAWLPVRRGGGGGGQMSKSRGGGRQLSKSRGGGRQVSKSRGGGGQTRSRGTGTKSRGGGQTRSRGAGQTRSRGAGSKSRGGGSQVRSRGAGSRSGRQQQPVRSRGAGGSRRPFQGPSRGVGARKQPPRSRGGGGGYQPPRSRGGGWGGLQSGSRRSTQRAQPTHFVPPRSRGGGGGGYQGVPRSRGVGSRAAVPRSRGGVRRYAY
eukprot:TRINITY_DN340_c1_g1_i1.p1 TRINITY_DN340_c1_g1~~TRINITY_DN340_c1_g1_i1.p1  ORF type:complete len:416 (+),score=122.85 TRINITY_DN340_c1_g1_i1:89-1249(+)